MAHVLEEVGLVGCADGLLDLSSNYKARFAESMTATIAKAR